jgi:hypothetical protein
MMIKKDSILAIFCSTVWIGVSEFFRNKLMFNSYWVEHYSAMGLVFPDQWTNGLVWGIWSLFFAFFIYIIFKKFSWPHTIFVSWFGGFVLMWLVVWNLGVLPLKILIVATPLSILEVTVACLIYKKFLR